MDQQTLDTQQARLEAILWRRRVERYPDLQPHLDAVQAETQANIQASAAMELVEQNRKLEAELAELRGESPSNLKAVEP